MTDRPRVNPEPVPVPELSATSPSAVTPSAESPAVVFWEVIAAGKRQVMIRFKDQTYQLRETRNGKLILTK